MSGGKICYVERPPVPPLRWAAAALWSLEGHLAGEVAALPKPYVEFIISLADGHRWRSADRIECFHGGWVTPLQTGPRYSTALGLTSFVGARLEPAAATALFGQLPLGDGVPPIQAANVLGANFRHLRNRLGEAQDSATRLNLLEAWLINRFASLSAPRNGVLRTLSIDGWRVDALCRTLGLDDRAARRRFQSEIGCSPKYWLRLHRFSAVLDSDEFQNGENSLATIAARFGLADQAHLAREFRLLAGMPPSSYQRRRNAEGLRAAQTMVPGSRADLSKSTLSGRLNFSASTLRSKL